MKKEWCVILLSTGRADGVRVNHVVGSLSHFADIPGGSLGKISIQQQHTLVDVPEKLAGRVLGKGDYLSHSEQNRHSSAGLIFVYQQEHIDGGGHANMHFCIIVQCNCI